MEALLQRAPLEKVLNMSISCSLLAVVVYDVLLEKPGVSLRWRKFKVQSTDCKLRQAIEEQAISLLYWSFILRVINDQLSCRN